MYFIFSKILYFLITPFFWICFLLILGLLIKKRPRLRKRLLLSSVVVFFVFSNPFLLRCFARFWNYPQTIITGKYSCAILLGGFASEKGNGNGYFNPSCDRFIEAAELKTTGKISHILISGGNASLNPDSFREADWVKNEFINLNIPDSSILIERNSRNTLENAQFSKNILATKHLKPPYVLITGCYHMRRAMYIFKKAGLDVVPYSAEHFSAFRRFSFDEFIPSPVILAEWNTYTKELIGYITVTLR